MEFLSKSECKKWCHNNHIALDGYERPALDMPEQQNKFDIPSDAGKRIALVKQQIVPFHKRSKMLMWVCDWSVWPSSEHYPLFDRLRLSYGCEAGLAEKPGHLFNAQEFEDMTSFLTLGVLFLWDCYLLTPYGKPALFYSHDECGIST